MRKHRCGVEAPLFLLGSSRHRLSCHRPTVSPLSPWRLSVSRFDFGLSQLGIGVACACALCACVRAGVCVCFVCVGGCGCMRGCAFVTLHILLRSHRPLQHTHTPPYSTSSPLPHTHTPVCSFLLRSKAENTETKRLGIHSDTIARLGISTLVNQEPCDRPMFVGGCEDQRSVAVLVFRVQPLSACAFTCVCVCVCVRVCTRCVSRAPATCQKQRRTCSSLAMSLPFASASELPPGLYPHGA